MARLALAVGAGVAGFLIGGVFGAGPIGAEIGLTIGSVEPAALFPENKEEAVHEDRDRGHRGVLRQAHG